MAAVVPARSLSSITTLAANPPQYPRNPTHVELEPLVLYIARVPGSRDVFLTPLKPRDKVVTAEDVHSSLYYLHFDHPDDVHLLETAHVPLESNERMLQPGNVQPPRPLVHRKPLPPDTVSRSKSMSTGSAGRKPVGSGLLSERVNIEQRNNVMQPRLSRKPTATQQVYHSRVHSAEAALPTENERPGGPGPPPVPPHRAPVNGRPGSSSSLAPGLPSQDDAGTSLTLIRRDPGSGAQWNIAKIKDFPMLEVSSASIRDNTSPRKSKSSLTPLHLEIHNPGYSKFLHNEDLAPHDTAGPPGHPQRDGVFRRRIWTEGMSRPSHRRDHSGSFDSTSSPSKSPRSSLDLHMLSRNLPLARDPRPVSFAGPSERRSSHFRGYVFLSPWNGRCEFNTGGASGSLKCKHILPNSNGAFVSPKVTVSELRFNLPSTHLRRPLVGRSESLFSGAGESSEVNNGADRLDLSLGQEFAGGGLGGKQAKLGKLIIESEGIKMLDLLVAANLAIWWRAYEKVHGDYQSSRGNASKA